MAAVKFQKPALFRKDMDAVLQTMVDEKIVIEVPNTEENSYPE